MFKLLQIVIKKLISTGDLRITDADGTFFHFGNQTGKPIHIKFNDKKWEKAVAIDPALKLGEAYMEGGFDFLEGDIFDLLELVFTNTGPNAEQLTWMRGLYFIRRHFKRLMQMNSLTRSSANVRHHYDLSGELYDLFLDSDRQYSCGYYETADASLEQAQLAKKRHLAAKLQINEGDRLLDIGCGWGGLGLYMAQYLKADVTGVTLSHEQHGIANQRAVDNGLSDHMRFLLQDYRNLNDTFDRIVSVGMFEHVGVGHYKEYFQHVAKLLKPDGRAVIHSIGRTGEPGTTNPFIRKYIFPGGYIPSLSEVLPVIEKSGLVVTDIEILRIHYADTLRDWRARFLKQQQQAEQLYDERFCRMWDFYLAASESAFRWQGMMVFQIQLAHKQDAVPLTRDYIYEEEQRLRALDQDSLKVHDAPEALSAVSSAKQQKSEPISLQDSDDTVKSAVKKPTSKKQGQTKTARASQAARAKRANSKKSVSIETGEHDI